MKFSKLLILQVYTVLNAKDFVKSMTLLCRKMSQTMLRQVQHRGVKTINAFKTLKVNQNTKNKPKNIKYTTKSYR